MENLPRDIKRWTAMSRELKAVPFEEFAANPAAVLDALDEAGTPIVVERNGRRHRVETEGPGTLARPSTAEASGDSGDIEALKAKLAARPSEEELARRQALLARILENRQRRGITPLTTADLVRTARRRHGRECYGTV